MTATYAAFAGVIGLAIGSFLNVVIHRLPRGESLVKPRSRCPECGAEIRPYDNLPVVSWLLLRGRCRSCGAQISAGYPLVELLTAALFVAVVLVKGADRDAWLGLAFVTVLVPVAFIDLDHRIIPNRILLPGAIVGIALVAAIHPGDLPEHLIAAAAAGGFLLLAAIAYPAGMGMGDVKLAAVMGLYLGRSVGPAMLAGLLAGTLVGMGIMARKGMRAGRKTAVPFGPFLALGGVVGLLAGPEIVDWYLDSFT
jgi:leader peptidase (prepilin peptidase) / N-methyltransferase